MEDSEQPSDERTRVLEAFYARVIQRVCVAYRDESELPVDEAIERLKQKWQEKLALYTGNRMLSNVVEDNTTGVLAVEATEELRSSSDSDVESSDGFSVSSSSSSSSSSSESEAASELDIGRPSTQVPGATSSIFAKMLGGKRKLNQLDGSASDDEDDVVQELQLQDVDTSTLILETSVQASGDEADGSSSEAEEELGFEGVHQDEEETKETEILASPADSSSPTSLLVSAEDLSPVSGLSGMNLPLQLAAEYSKFSHRGKRRGYFGELEAIILTWPSCLGGNETAHPGDLIWCCPAPEQGLLVEGELVKVVSLGGTLSELKIQHSNGMEATVRRSQVRRLKEFLITKGSVRFSSEQ